MPENAREVALRDAIARGLNIHLRPSPEIAPDERFCRVIADHVRPLLTAHAEQAVAAWRHEHRAFNDGTHCDLCTESVRGDGISADSEWRWVDDGWSLACLACLDKAVVAIRQRATPPPAGEEIEP